MAKKKQIIELEGLNEVDFKKEVDLKAAESIIKPKPPSRRRSTQKSLKTPIKKPKEVVIPKRSTPPPPLKKRSTFNIDEDLHRALRDYSFFEEIDMVEYIFEQLVKPDLTKKGYYPPRKRKK